VFFSEAVPILAKPARVDLSNGAEDVVFLVNGTAAVSNESSAPLLASCHLLEETSAGSRAFGVTWVTVPAASGGNPGVANVAMAGWTVVLSSAISTVTVQCSQPIVAATAVGTRVGLFIIQ
jgi:hypothetical protein